MMTRLSDRLRSALNFKFTSFSGNTRRQYKDEEEFKEHKKHVVVSFLALLELIKQNMILAEQNNLFEEIDVQGLNVNTPKYDNI